MGSYCRFASKEAALADSWFSGVEATLNWTKGNPIGTGESKSFLVTSDDGVRGVAKPAFTSDGNEIPRAAHEKIAADLAHLVRLPVPPVVLWTDPSDGTQYSISAWGFAQPLTWQQAKNVSGTPVLTPLLVDNCKPVFSASIAFHTWIDDADRNDGNILIDAAAPEDRPGVAFIDHAFSMTYRWSYGVRPLIVPVQHGYFPHRTPIASVVAEMARAVQNLPEDKVRGVVERIPAIYLSSTRRMVIIENLVRRQAELAGALGVT